MGSPPIGTSMTTFTSSGGFFPILIASRRIELVSGTGLGAFSGEASSGRSGRRFTGENAAKAGHGSGLTKGPAKPLPKLDASLAGASPGNKKRNQVFRAFSGKDDLSGPKRPSAEEVGHLGQRRAPDALLDAGNLLPAHSFIEGASALVVLQRPDDDPLHLPMPQVVAHGLEQAPAEAETLVFRQQVKLVDFAPRRQRTIAAAAVGGIAHSALADIQNHQRPTAGDRGAPPALAAPREHLLKGDARNDAEISLAPSRIENLGQCSSVIGLGVTDADEKIAHVFVKAREAIEQASAQDG